MPKLAQYKERLLDEFEQRDDDWTYGTFESELSRVRKGASYHDAKGIISTAHELGKWPNAVKRYILTNYSSFGNVSCELNSVLQDVYAGLSPQEKKYWGIE